MSAWKAKRRRNASRHRCGLNLVCCSFEVARRWRNREVVGCGRRVGRRGLGGDSSLHIGKRTNFLPLGFRVLWFVRNPREGSKVVL